MSESLAPAVVYDVNVFVNAVVGADSEWPYLARLPPATGNADADCLSVAFDAEEFSLCTSLHILENVARVLRSFGWSHRSVEEYVDALAELVETSGGKVLDPDRRVFDVPDFEDNLILDVAVASDALIVVSDDTDLTSMSPWNQRIAILRPRDFIRRIVQQRRGR
ncbi:putative toxin-antitoxin system toxin component, PIN family [Myceligenerans crystallogenes]|uniref:PIN domain-containing protein n=1 Tax=Myceligenerans crystallogenes TaxID=316335 RepID=A0ABN2N4G4_9MICO